ncbi:MAG: hypothetical protein SP1CHLAM54_17640 [Chlamydiia bacterium]|nr:hypothetical protein [Chlamydiia bacterium]MCH9616652.1 hypothetical protein [Chlamydiia bacterium]MCH9629382.1 hypothetical protein [Chlamydiia bacterium]
MTQLPTPPPTDGAQGKSTPGDIANSGDAQLFLLASIASVNAVRNTLYSVLQKFAANLMKAQVAAGFSGAKSLSSSATTSFYVGAAGNAIQVGINLHGATSGVREYKSIEDSFTKGPGGINDLQRQLDDIDDEFKARENGGNGAARLTAEEQGDPALEARRADRGGGTGTDGDSQVSASRRPELQGSTTEELTRRRESVKQQLETKQTGLRRALDQHKGKLDRNTQMAMGLSGLATSSSETIKQTGQAAAQADSSTSSISKDSEQYVNSAAQTAKQSGDEYGQAAGQAMAASQATAGR